MEHSQIYLIKTEGIRNKDLSLIQPNIIKASADMLNKVLGLYLMLF